MRRGRLLLRRRSVNKCPFGTLVANVKKNPHADADTDRCVWRRWGEVRGWSSRLCVPDGRCVLFVLAGVYSHVTLRYWRVYRCTGCPENRRREGLLKERKKLINERSEERAATFAYIPIIRARPVALISFCLTWYARGRATIRRRKEELPLRNYLPLDSRRQSPERYLYHYAVFGGAISGVYWASFDRTIEQSGESCSLNAKRTAE